MLLLLWCLQEFYAIKGQASHSEQDFVFRSLMCTCNVMHDMEQYCNACAMVFLQLLRVLNEPAVHVRTRAMKALSTIIAADPSILSRVGERNDTLALPYSYPQWVTCMMSTKMVGTCMVLGTTCACGSGETPQP